MEKTHEANKSVSPTLVCCFSNNCGGMELLSFGLTKLLSPLGDVSLVTRTNNFIHTNASKYGVTSPVIGISFRGNFSFSFIKEFQKIIEDKKIKNVIFLGASELRSLYFACRNKDINFINVHGTTKTHSKKDFFHKMIYKVVSTHVTVSDHIQRNVKKIIPFFDHTKIKTIYLPKEVDHSFTTKEKKRFKCLLVARIAGGKGHEDAIDACTYALNQGFDVELNFVGNTENEKVYQTIKEKLSHSPLKDRCHFLGHQQDVSTFYKDAHIFLFPSLGEGLPTVLLEAFQYGVLPITYDNTVFPEFFLMGFKFPMVPDRSVSVLSETLVDTLKTYSSWESDISENYKLAKNLFSTKRIQQEYLSILK